MGAGWQAGISEREREVLAAVARHRTNAQIARELSVSVRTVESPARHPISSATCRCVIPSRLRSSARTLAHQASIVL